MDLPGRASIATHSEGIRLTGLQKIGHALELVGDLLVELVAYG